MGICDVIIDIITDIITAIVDVITTIVDVVVGIVDAVLAPIANLLGFTDGSDGSTVFTFEVHNQNLFEKPDRKASAEVIANAIINSRDISGDLLYAATYQSGKRNVRKFVDFIDDGDYFEGFPELKGNILTIDYDEIDDILTSASSAYNGNGGHGAPVTIDNARLGTLFVIPWQKYWLQQNKAYVHETSVFTHSGTATTVNLSNSIHNSSDKTYTMRTGSPLSNFGGFNIPLKPLGLHYVVNYHLDSAPNVNKLFIYKVPAAGSSGVYTNLDTPSTTMTTAGSDTLSVLPAIPLRLNNTNFNASGQNTAKRDKIIALVDKVGLDAENLIATVMEDVSDASIAANKIDHVYLNFGVRFYDDSQIAMNYAFRFISTLFPGQGTTKAIYDSTPSGDVKPYNTLLVEADNYKFAFTYAYITFANYSLSAINAAGASSDIYARYHANSAKFTGGYLTSTYYTSSNENSYNVGYFVSNTTELAAYIAGTLTQESAYSSEAANWMQPTQLIAYSGVLINADNSTNSDGVIRPSALYEIIPVGSTTISSNTTYQVIDGSPTLKIEISGGGGGGGSGSADGGGAMNGGSGGTTYARVYNAGGSLLNTYSAGGGGGGTGNAHETSTGKTGIHFGGPGSNGVPSGASSIFAGTGGAANNDDDAGDASGHSAGGGGGGEDGGIFHDDDSGNPGGRGTYYTVNHSVANNTDYVVVTIGGGGSKGTTGQDGGLGSPGVAVLTAAAVTNGLKLINKANESTTVGTSFTYYQNVVNGMNAYTVQSPKTMLRVIDAETTKFKMVTFDLTDPTGLMIPFSYEVIKDLPNDHVTSLFVASAHLSIYVADVQTITVPWWVKILKIVQVLLFLFAIITGQFATAQALIAMLKQIVVNFLIKKAIVFIAKEISPELAVIVAIFMAYQMSGGEDIDFSEFTDVVKLLENTTDIMSQVYLEIAEDVSESLMAEQKVEDDARDQAIKLLEDAEAAMDTNSLVKSYRANLLPMMATRYYDYFNNFQTLAVNEYDYDEKINAQYNRNDM